MYERCRSLLAAGRGEPEAAERWAAATIERGERTGVRWDVLEAYSARSSARVLAEALDAALHKHAARAR